MQFLSACLQVSSPVIGRDRHAFLLWNDDKPLYIRVYRARPDGSIGHLTTTSLFVKNEPLPTSTVSGRAEREFSKQVSSDNHIYNS